MSQRTECPVCDKSLPPNETHRESNEAHIAACIENHLSHQLTLEESSLPQRPEQEQCPVCHIPFSAKNGTGSQNQREAHIFACLDGTDSAVGSDSAASNLPGYAKQSQKAGSKAREKMSDSKTAEKQDGLYAPPPGPPPSRLQRGPSSVTQLTTSSSVSTAATSEISEGRRPSMFQRLTSKLSGDSRTPEEKEGDTMAKADELMQERWGPPGSQTHEMVMRYWVATRMESHWSYLRAQHPRQFKKNLSKGYMEPIPTTWVRDRRLAFPYPEFSTYENAAEERLYYLLNNGVMPDGSRHAPLRPLNVNRDMYTIIRRGNERNARQVMIDPNIIAQYHSPSDVFRSDRQIKSHEYSAQVPNITYDARRMALHELAEGIMHGTDHLETMLLIDISGSMTWNPHAGMMGPDGVLRYHDQPPNIQLVEHLVHRVLHHMIPRAQREHPAQKGIDTVTFSTYGAYIGQLTTANWRHDWATKVGSRLGGGTQVMQGWQAVKNTYFTHQHEHYGHGRFDPVFGWQPTPGMPKLSLLVFLDGEASDMDEFELELLGETWAYVTIALVGMENCPHHHSHAVELERVARFNPHVGFYDVHGRVLERLVVQELLASVYPVDPPAYQEILKPDYDLKPDELPAYAA